MPRTSATTSKKVSSQASKAEAAKTASRAKSKSPTAAKSSGDGIVREKMIAVAAYFRAEHRGFNCGDPVEDWLAAEAEVDAMLGNTRQPAVH
jgi:Protein of unknown function (DUF2934)